MKRFPTLRSLILSLSGIVLALSAVPAIHATTLPPVTAVKPTITMQVLFAPSGSDIYVDTYGAEISGTGFTYGGSVQLQEGRKVFGTFYPENTVLTKASPYSWLYLNVYGGGSFSNVQLDLQIHPSGTVIWCRAYDYGTSTWSNMVSFTF